MKILKGLIQGLTEYCIDDTFVDQCDAPDEIMLVQSAVYGRMSVIAVINSLYELTTIKQCFQFHLVLIIDKHHIEEC